MSASNKDSIISRFFKSTKKHPIIVAIAAGLYPLLFYYSNNFTLINSWEQGGYFITLFLIIPIVVFWSLTKIARLNFLKKWAHLLLPFLNIFTFLFLIKLAVYADIKKKITVGILFIAALFAWFLWKHLKKVVVFQILLAFVGIFVFFNTLARHLNFDDRWKQQPDAITTTKFVTKPNVYVIQPDGYLNFSEISKGYYELDNSDMESFLKDADFVNYPNFRSNYASTLSSNSSIFMMKHHYYNNNESFSEGLNARNTILSKNAVLDIFHNNGYTTHFITEKPYLMANRPKMGYTKSNFSYSEIPYLTTGMNVVKNAQKGLANFMNETNSTPSFYFVEIFNPGHITNSSTKTKGVDGEKKLWIESLKVANSKLKSLIDTIKEKDKEALIIIMADHGGYVGFNYSLETTKKIEDRDLIYSMFSAQLSILWPDTPPEYQNKLHSNVNIFRILFTYLSGNTTYLKHLEDDSSYMIIKDGATPGVYKYIDHQGNTTFKQYIETNN